MIRVILESPYSPSNGYPLEHNLAYARACLQDCLLRGEAPFASHLLYTQPGVLDDNVPEQRKLGIQAGFVWRPAAAKTVVYTDLGYSQGMVEGIVNATKDRVPVEYRKLGGTWAIRPSLPAPAAEPIVVPFKFTPPLPEHDYGPDSFPGQDFHD